jgi:hypothetical protein
VGLLMVFWQPGRNLWFGVRLPWTLADSYIWKKSWRLASRLLMVMGITVLISWRAFWISAAHLIGLSCLYTVLLYRWKYGTYRFWKEIGWIDYRPVARCAHCGHFQKLRDENEAPVATCEACGHLCRSRDHGRHPIIVFFHNLWRNLPARWTQGAKNPPKP